MRSRGSKVALLAGLGVAAVTGVAILRWKEIATHYHLLRLEREPDYLLRIVEKPEGSPERNAIGKFLETRAGKEALFRAYYGESVGALKGGHGVLFSGEKGLIRLNEMSLAIEWPLDEDMILFTGGELTAEGRSLRRAILTLVPAIEGESFRHLEEPAYVFQILRRDEALGSFYGTYAVAGPMPDAEDYLCLLLRDGMPSKAPDGN